MKNFSLLLALVILTHPVLSRAEIDLDKILGSGVPSENQPKGRQISSDGFTSIFGRAMTSANKRLSLDLQGKKLKGVEYDRSEGKDNGVWNLNITAWTNKVEDGTFGEKMVKVFKSPAKLTNDGSTMEFKFVAEFPKEIEAKLTEKLAEVKQETDTKYQKKMFCALSKKGTNYTLEARLPYSEDVDDDDVEEILEFLVVQSREVLFAVADLSADAAKKK